MPGITSKGRLFAASKASGMPSIVSWSVSAIAESPFCAASSTTLAGV